MKFIMKAVLSISVACFMFIAYAGNMEANFSQKPLPLTKNQEQIIDNILINLQAHSLNKINSAYSPLIAERTFTKILRNDIIIKNSFYTDGLQAGTPKIILDKVFDAYSWKVRRGDQVSVLYLCDYSRSTGDRLSCDDILYVKVEQGDKLKEIVLFEHEDGRKHHYASDEIKVKERFLKAPLDMSKARVSSNFGVRVHPISKKRKPHNGVDFAAPTGTKIYAAADGVITKRHRSRSAGNLIEIDHGDYITVYMHQNRFAKGLKVGSRVQQGQLIGYVGTTGFSTGPHLHYELRRAENRAAVDPFEVAAIFVENNTGVNPEKFNNRMRRLKFIHGATAKNVPWTPQEILMSLYTETPATVMLKSKQFLPKSLFSQGVTTLDVSVKERPIMLVS